MRGGQRRGQRVHPAGGEDHRAGPRQRRPRAGILGGRPPHVAAGPTDAADQLAAPNRVRRQRYWARSAGRQRAARPAVRSRTASRRRPAGFSPACSEDIVGDLSRSVPHVQAPAQLAPVPHRRGRARTAAPNWHCPYRPAPASCPPAGRAGRRSARRSVRRGPPAPPAGRSRRLPIPVRCGRISATTGTAAVGDVDAALPAVRRPGWRRRARPAAHRARPRRPRWWVSPCQSPRWVSRSRVSTFTGTPQRSPSATGGVVGADADRRTR